MSKAMWHKGYRYRKNYKELPGTPDIVLTKNRIAIFCDSEFFHGKDWDTLQEKLKNGKNPDYWIPKISRNIERDQIKDNKNYTDECVKAVEETIFDLLMNQDLDDGKND